MSKSTYEQFCLLTTPERTKFRQEYCVVKVFETKIQSDHLSHSQREDLSRAFLEMKWYWNAFFAIGNDGNKIWEYPSSKTTVTHLDKDKNPVEEEFKVLGSAHRQTVVFKQLKSACKSIKTNKKNGNIKGSKGIGFKSEKNSIEIRNGQWEIVSKNRIKILGLGERIRKKPFRVRGLDQLRKYSFYHPANAHLIRKPDGLYIHITVYVLKDELEKVEKNYQTLGIDFGCKDTFTIYNHERNQAVKLNVQFGETECLKRIQRKTGRRFSKNHSNKSKNGFKLRLKLRKQYQKIENRKKDATAKFIHEMKKYERVCIQDELLSLWQKGNHGKKVQHSIMGRVKSKLKTMENVEVLSSRVPTSKTCPVCGCIHKGLGFSSLYICPECGYNEDRDIHAARNMVLLSNENSVGWESTDFKPVEFNASVTFDSFVNPRFQVWTAKQETLSPRRARVVHDSMMSGVGKNSRLSWSAFETIKEAMEYIEDLKKDGLDFSDITVITPEGYKE